MPISSPTYTCKDPMGRIILSGMEEILGCIEISSVIDQADLVKDGQTGHPLKQDLALSFEMLPQLQDSLETTFGRSAGRGLAIRSGRSSFRHLLREFGKEMGLLDLEFRLLSLPDRQKFSNRALAALINRHTGLQVLFEMDENFFNWTISQGTANNKKHNRRSSCYLIFGVLQEMVSWVSGDKIYQMEETQCIEKGDPCCRIRIRKNPIS